VQHGIRGEFGDDVLGGAGRLIPVSELTFSELTFSEQAGEAGTSAGR